MTDFFTALEAELHAATVRRPRRPIRAGQALGALAVVALLAVAVGLVLAISGGGEGRGDVAGGKQPDPVGTVLPKSETYYETSALVVAIGRAPVSGPWQIEVSRTKGSRDTEGRVMWHRGYCMSIRLVDPPDREAMGGSGFCGAPRSLGFRKTPGFSRSQTEGPRRPPAKEVLVWGRVPDRASKVIITAPGRQPIEVVPEDGPRSFPGKYYGIPVKPGMPGARINWLDSHGEPGSRGIRLMPPITRL
jgi:hypothetical protein